MYKLSEMKKLIINTLAVATISVSAFGQTYLDSTINSSTKRIQFANPNQFSIGSYGEAHFNQAFKTDTYENGKVDLHRIILFTGYKFNQNLQFFSEIEFEHVKEVYIEQAFLNYSFNSLLNVKAGMILIPMGYVNEFHEPTLFNGVERPNFNKYIIPTTWREIGFGFHGLIKKANLKYQLYLVNGFNGYDGSPKLSGKNGLRSGRQKGAEASLNDPALTGKLTFFGLNGLRLGVSGYCGKTESNLYGGLDKSDDFLIAQADSSRVGIVMAAVNIHYNIKNFQFTAVGNYTSVSNTDQYNAFTGSDLGNEIFGYYTELAYRQSPGKSEYPKLIPFVRYENFNTHYSVNADVLRNESYHREELTVGTGLQLTPGSVLKADFQWIKTAANPKPYKMLNIGFGYWF